MLVAHAWWLRGIPWGSNRCTMRPKRTVGLFLLPKCELYSKAACRILELTLARWLDIWHMAPFRSRSRSMMAYFPCLAVAGRNGMSVGMSWREEDTGNFHCQTSRSAGVVLQISWKRVAEYCRNRC